jgi:magnesium chelatase subunit D
VTPASKGAVQWALAVAAIGLLASGPARLGGLHLRARPGPARERFMALLADAFADRPSIRLTPATAPEALDGGLDVAATLAAGQPVMAHGLLAGPAALFLLPMAERCPPRLAARLAAALDDGPGHVLVALDEGEGTDETLPPALAERLALVVDLGGLALADCAGDGGPAALNGGAAPADPAAALAALAARLGIVSMRAPIQALAAARASAARAGRAAPDAGDMALAAGLVIGPRARVLPEAAPDRPEPPPPPESADDPPPAGEEADRQRSAMPQDILLDAVRATLPPGLIDGLQAVPLRRAAGSGAGAARVSNRRGRPVPSRPGRPDGDSRLDILATLRAAAPWQRLRGRDRPPLALRPADLRIRRFEERSDRLVIFAVDASGSAAVARLAEAKGAVETMLAEAYARRDLVALIAFRGERADLLLPPTRSLVQAKRRLARLPGGGGTPLAAGLAASLDLGLKARARGMSPAIAILTDGRANVALDPGAGRAAALADAERLARALAGSGLPALVLDTATRPSDAAATLARNLRAPCAALPRSGAAALGRAVSAAFA